jgi:hypothetical protein
MIQGTPAAIKCEQALEGLRRSRRHPELLFLVPRLLFPPEGRANARPSARIGTFSGSLPLPHPIVQHDNAEQRKDPKDRSADWGP